MIICISISGWYLIPYIIISQDFEFLHNHLKKYNLRVSVDFAFKSRPKVYINADLFKDYTINVFLPNLNKFRSNQKFADQEAVLLIDNCPNQIFNEISSFLCQSYARIIIITFVTHTKTFSKSLIWCYLAFAKAKTLSFAAGQRNDNRPVPDQSFSQFQIDQGWGYYLNRFWNIWALIWHCTRTQ
jgi:hypothetical protein